MPPKRPVFCFRNRQTGELLWAPSDRAKQVAEIIKKQEASCPKLSKKEVNYNLGRERGKATRSTGQRGIITMQSRSSVSPLCSLVNAKARPSSGYSRMTLVGLHVC